MRHCQRGFYRRQQRGDVLLRLIGLPAEKGDVLLLQLVDFQVGAPLALACQQWQDVDKQELELG
jgi:hypothetical protein